MSLGRPPIPSIAASDGETPHVASCHAYTAGPLQPPESEAKSRTVLVIRNKQMQRRAVMHNSIVSCRVMALEACLGQSPGSLRLFLGSGYRGWQKGAKQQCRVSCRLSRSRTAYGAVHMEKMN